MTHNELIDALATHPFLAGISPKTLEALVPLSQVMGCMPGQYLGREGEDAQAFYLVTSGHVDLELNVARKGTVRLSRIGPGEVVGWSWLLPPHRWQFSAKASEAVRCIELDAVRLRALCDTNIEIGYELVKRLMAVVCGRLAVTRRRLIEQGG